VAGDRGFYSQANEDWLHDNGVRQVSIPARGKISEARRAYQKQSWFKRLQRFRAGGEAKISLLKRKFGLRRSLMRGDAGVKIWVGQGIFIHNLASRPNSLRNTWKREQQSDPSTPRSSPLMIMVLFQE